MDYYVGEFEDMYKPPFYFTFSDKINEHEKKFSEIVSRCINYELHEKYGLLGYSKVEDCMTRNEDSSMGELMQGFRSLSIIQVLWTIKTS